jgi:hypothetical protein
MAKYAPGKGEKIGMSPQPKGKQFKDPKGVSPKSAKLNDPTQRLADEIKSNRAKRKGTK